MVERGSTARRDPDGIDRVVHEPARLRLLTRLFVVESADFLVLMRQAGLTQGNLSSHMSRLEAAGYVQVDKAFVDRRPRTLLRLTAAGRAALERYVRYMKRLFAEVETPGAVKRRRAPRLRNPVRVPRGHAGGSMTRLSPACRGVISRRLHNQRLTGSTFHDPVQAVAWHGAVQAQEYAVAKWALGLRCNGATDAGVESAVRDGRILRTHAMRPTWHFVTPADIRWLLTLTAPRIKAAMAWHERQLGLTARIFARSQAIVARALEGQRFLSRTELGSILAQRGIEAQGQRLGQLMMQAELDQVICSGPRRGKQFTYALLDERAPRADVLSREASLAKLTRRYFSSHGPATVRDYAWWSGLTMREARLGVELCGPALIHEVIEELSYFSAPGAVPSRPAEATYLLPIYDEYLIAYKDRELITGRLGALPAHAAVSAGFPHSLIVDGRLAGRWGLTARGKSVVVSIVPHRRLSSGETRQVKLAAGRFGGFHGTSTVAEVRPFQGTRHTTAVL